MKFYILYDYDNGPSIIGAPRKKRIEAETLELALQKYNAVKAKLKTWRPDARVFGLERIDQEEIVTTIL